MRETERLKVQIKKGASSYFIFPFPETTRVTFSLFYLFHLFHLYFVFSLLCWLVVGCGGGGGGGRCCTGLVCNSQSSPVNMSPVQYIPYIQYSPGQDKTGKSTATVPTAPTAPTKHPLVPVRTQICTPRKCNQTINPS